MSKIKRILKDLFKKKEKNLQDLIQPWGESSGTFVDCKPGDPTKVDFLDLNSITEVKTGDYSQDTPPHLSPTGDWMRKGETYKIVGGDLFKGEISLKKRRKIPGYNYLHRHPRMESKFGLGEDHVIVDKKDWDEVIEYLLKNGNFLKNGSFQV